MRGSLASSFPEALCGEAPKSQPRLHSCKKVPAKHEDTWGKCQKGGKKDQAHSHHGG